MAKKRNEARNIMKFGKNVDLERKYFDKWKTKGMFRTLEIQGSSGPDHLLHQSAHDESKCFQFLVQERKRSGSGQRPKVKIWIFLKVRKMFALNLKELNSREPLLKRRSERK